MKSQWESFLENKGEWRGSFTSLSLNGEALSDVPSVLKIEPRSETLAHFSLQRENAPDMAFDVTAAFSRDLLFFEDGSFSKGSMQLSPFGQFDGELAMTTPDRRLRLVQLFENLRLTKLTLIREQHAGSTVPERPPLQVNDLLGNWHGEAVTLYPDWRSPDTYTTQLTIDRVGDRLQQELQFAGRSISTSAAIQGSKLVFDQSTLPIQILLLPDGASCNCPLEVKLGQPFVLELGWLLEPGVRRRMMRSYDAKGEWTSLTIVTEQRS